MNKRHHTSIDSKTQPHQMETPVTNENIFNLASKAAYTTVRYLYRKSPDESLGKLLNGFAHLQDINNDTADLIQVAAIVLAEHKYELEEFLRYELGEFLQCEQCEPEIFKIACREVRRYIYSQNRQQVKTAFTPLYKALLKIRKLLKGQNIKASPEQLAKLKQIVADKKITVENIELLISEEKTRSKKTYIRTNMHIIDLKHGKDYITDESGEITNEDDDITKPDENDAINLLIEDISNNDMIMNIANALQSTKQRQIFDYMKSGYTNSEIAAKMDISKPRVTQHIKRIREIAKALYPNGINQ